MSFTTMTVDTSGLEEQGHTLCGIKGRNKTACDGRLIEAENECICWCLPCLTEVRSDGFPAVLCSFFLCVFLLL